MATRQREISVAEFFTKNRHLLGFDNPKKALLTTVKEAVDNALDACEEGGILPEVFVEITPEGQDRFKVVIEDNGPGIVKSQIPRIFGKLLYGSKFHRLKQSRGQQGIGISAAAMYGQLTTGTSCRIISRTGPKRPAHYFEIHIDTKRNAPEVVKDEVVEWNREHGTRVEIHLEGIFQRGRRSIEEYLEQVLIANPHVTLHYKAPDGQEMYRKRATEILPIEAAEIKPHPHGIELGLLMQMLKATRARNLKGFLTTEFARVGPTIAETICANAKLPPTARPSRIARQEADALYRAVRKTKIPRPPTNCLSPIGEELMLAGLKRVAGKAEFSTAVSRNPAVYRGNPFLVEAALAWGVEGRDADSPADLVRFANRVPLQYQQAGCAITKAVVGLNWRAYGLTHPRTALPQGPLVIAVHIASAWVPFTSESKEAIASYPEILKEIRLALQECGRRLGIHIRKKARIADAEKKRSYIQTYIPQVALALQQILSLSEASTKKATRNLTTILEKSRKF
ncbi:MAG: DNA topoisomerase VI subunit B [Candidatus Hydrogenedentota bacterium]|nr:MAG: DNA topoisomerase VI subunit B [Candidatus Hydrogenedentota bacterium]